MAGRKPLELGHVETLDGSQRAKERMRVFFQTLHGELTVPDACLRLGLHESYFHELRHRWLQSALALLEPRPVGRPPQQPPEENPLARDNARLAAEAEALCEELRAAEVRAEIERIQRGARSRPRNDALPGAPASAPAGAPAGAGKKTAPPL